MLLAALATACAVDASEADLRLQVFWGDSQPQSWHGEISISSGTLSESRTLGLAVDQPGTLQRHEQRLVIAPRGPRRYDGVEMLVRADDDAVLRIALSPDRSSPSPEVIEIPVGTLVDGPRRITLQDQQNRILVQRAPGDRLRVRLRRDSLIFSPGEHWLIDVDPHRLGTAATGSLRCQLQLTPARDDRQLWQLQRPLRSGADGSLAALQDLAIPVPRQEGVYDLAISVDRAGLASPFRQIKPTKPLARRLVQFVVMAPERPPSGDAVGETEVASFNPAHPRWFERLAGLPQWNLLWPGLRQGSLQNRPVESWNHGGRVWTRLPPDGWVAYPLPVQQAGQAHALEIEFPGDLPQTVGVSLVEPNAAGEVVPIGLDSGIRLGDPDLPMATGTATEPITRHRLLFWPRTNSPLLLITNRQQQGSAVFGALHIRAQNGELPVSDPGWGRKRMAYLDRPLFPENFSASEVLDPATQRSLEDWVTFYEGGRRLVEYLRFAGYDGVAIGVACDGSALYPSDVLEPTARYDRGALHSNGSDVVRKDVLELLFRLFDREGLQLTPVVHFATPLPDLEALLAGRGEEATGLELLDQEGRRWRDVHPESNGLAPYYNPLDERVQQAMVAVTGEIADRYAHHASFAGLTVAMSAEGYTQLPDLNWGLDDATLIRFRQSLTETEATAAGDSLGQLRRQLAAGPSEDSPPVVQAWLSWRAEQLTRLYRNMVEDLQRRVAAARDADRDPAASRLLLSAVHLAESAPWQRHLQPALPRNTTVDDALRAMGIDATALGQLTGLVLTRPHRIAPLTTLATRSVALETNAAEEIDQRFSSPSLQVTHFYHEPQRLSLPSFDQQAPFGRNVRTQTSLLSLITPAGWSALEHYAHSLAMRDDEQFLEGGWTLPMGQEAATRPFFEVFRQLPASRFQTLDLEAHSPVTARFHADRSHAYLYLVNDSPWTTEVDLRLHWPPGCRYEPLAGRTPRQWQRQDRTGDWQLSLSAYELLAWRFSAPQVRVVSMRTKTPAAARQQLALRLEEIAARADQVQSPEPLDMLADPSFESPIGRDTAGPWVVSAGPLATASSDTRQTFAGSQSLLLTSEGDRVAVHSQPFEAPPTGQLSLFVRLRSDRPRQRPPVRVCLETTDPSCQPEMRLQAPLSDDWRYELALHADDLPIRDTTPLLVRVRFELTGPGKVWIDDLRLYDRWFERDEYNALLKILQVAHTQRVSGDVAGCYRTLSGYWPRFLLRHVPPPPERVAARPNPQPAPATAAGETPGVLQRMKRYLPRLLRF